MQLSRSESPSKTDPLVGAVLVNSAGQVIARAHRGKYGTGDHGEFSLFEKLDTRVPPGSTLYVTLEPCTKRNPPKVPCVERVIASQVQRIVIGMKDPNPDIYGKGIERLNREGIHVGLFDEDLAEEIRDHNSDFLKEQAERATAARTESLQSPDREENRPVPNAGTGDLSNAALRKYVHALNPRVKVPSPALWNQLTKSAFLKKADRGNQFLARVAGVVVFAKRPHQFLPQCTIKADRYPGPLQEAQSLESITAQEEIVGPLANQIEACLDFYKRNAARVRDW